MAKINFSKVEEAFNSGLYKMKVDHLGKLADFSKALGKPEMRKIAEKAVVIAEKQALEKKGILYV